MAGKLPMGQKELMRAKLMEQVVQKQLSLKDAAVKLKVGDRQAKRILKRYRQDGDKGMLHGNLGNLSPNRIDQQIRDTALAYYKRSYHDFGPTLAAEKLAECHDIHVDHETLRRWLIDETIWGRHRRRKAYRSRRDRKPCFGDLVQFDGSHHDWFEGRRTKCCLMNMVDDATGVSLSFLSEEETTADAMTLLWRWIERYGIPQAVYCDKKNAFVLNKEPTIEEQLAGIEPKSHFEVACDKLGIEVIVANSPQAKGRVERNHGVYQDRFVKELRLAKIDTIDAANIFLEKNYLPSINKKFAKKPELAEDAHAPLLDKAGLKDIFCYETTRVVSNDFIISYESRIFQITKEQKLLPRPRDKVTVRELLDGTLNLLWQNTSLAFVERDNKRRKENPVALSA
jgi:transposase